METIQWKKTFLRITEVYGSMNKSIPLPESDIVMYSKLTRLPESRKNTINKRFKTLHVDLAKDEQTLFAEIKKKTRYEIRRAKSEPLAFYATITLSATEINQFIKLYRQFAAKKKIQHCPADKLHSLRKKGLLALTRVLDSDDQILCAHAYSLDCNRACGLYSYSSRFTAAPSRGEAIGRANKYLHWQGMLFFKDNGFSIYDFGGLSMEKDNREQENINKFKKRFGGSEVMEYKCVEARTGLGKLALFYLSWKWKDSPELVNVNLS